MALPKIKIEESTLGERVARIEAQVEHIRSGIAELKLDMRQLDAKIDTKFDSLDKKVDAKIEVRRAQ